MSEKSDFESCGRLPQDVMSSELIHFADQNSVLTNTQFIDALLQASGTTKGRESLINALNAGTKTRAQALLQVQQNVFAIFSRGRQSDPPLSCIITWLSAHSTRKKFTFIDGGRSG